MSCNYVNDEGNRCGDYAGASDLCPAHVSQTRQDAKLATLRARIAELTTQVESLGYDLANACDDARVAQQEILRVQAKYEHDMEAAQDRFRRMDQECERLRKGLQEIANLHVTVDSGRFGAFVSARAVNIAEKTLTAPGVKEALASTPEPELHGVRKLRDAGLE